MPSLTVNNLVRVVRNPRLLSGYLARKFEDRKVRARFVRSIFKNKKEFFGYVREVEDSGLVKDLEAKRRKFEKSIRRTTYRGHPYSFGAIRYEEALLLYGFIRKFRPEILVETGVCNGVSTAFILLALHNNSSGQLYSIDLPEIDSVDYQEDTFWKGKGGSIIPKNQESGWIIPNYLRKRWKLILGKSQEKLSPLLEELGPIDFFMHDSEHSYECMMFEFTQAFRALKISGILVSDDIVWNHSFYDFCKRQGREPMHMSSNIGFIFKGAILG